MALTLPPKVNPGDLITAYYMDQIVDALTNLNQRVTVLESTGAVVNTVQITGFTATQPIHIGDQIAINGSGFVVPAVLNQVSMGGIQVVNLNSGLSSSTQLVFNVPNIPGIVSSGTPVSVTVANTNGSATAPFQILVQPANVAPTGETTFAYSTPPVMPSGQLNITSGQNYAFGFKLTAVTNLPANYSLSVGSVTGTGWSAQITGSTSVTIPAGGSTTVSVQVTAGSGAGSVSLSAVETTPGTKVAPGSTPALTITAGSPPPTPVTSMVVSLDSASFGASVSGTGVTFIRSQMGVVAFTVWVTQAGNGYAASAAMQAPNGWTPGNLTGSPFNVQPAPPAGQPAKSPITAQFTAGSGAAGTTLVFTAIAPDGTTVSYALPVTVTG